MEIRQIIFSPFRLDLADERLVRGKKEVRLHPKAFAVLRCLTENSGGLVTKHTLMATVWPGTNVTDAVLTESIRELRKGIAIFIELAKEKHYRDIRSRSHTDRHSISRMVHAY